MCYVLLVIMITLVPTAIEECECCASVHILSTERLGLRKWKYLGVENLFWTWTVTCKYLVHIAGIECPCCLAETLRVLTVNHLRLHYLIVHVQYPYIPMTLANPPTSVTILRPWMDECGKRVKKYHCVHDYNIRPYGNKYGNFIYALDPPWIDRVGDWAHGRHQLHQHLVMGEFQRVRIVWFASLQMSFTDRSHIVRNERREMPTLPWSTRSEICRKSASKSKKASTMLS